MMVSKRVGGSEPPYDNGAKPATVPIDGTDHMSPSEPGKDYTPVTVPNGWTLPYKIVDGIKVFHLVAEEVQHEFAPGLTATCWGYNGSVHGPVIEAVEGDRVRIFATNKLSAPTTVHWHGAIVPSGMDGVGGLSQAPILPGETFMYEFTLRQHGTLMYHSHHDEMTQMGMGMTGLFIIHPRNDPRPRVQRDYALMLHEWKIEVGASRPDPNEMSEFNVLTINGRCFPGTEPLLASIGDRVRIRIGNLSAMDHHPIHLHGYAFRITETDGGTIPEADRRPETTVLLPVGSTRTIEFEANNPGDWAMHCHMTHHVMNQMGHGMPNMIGVKPGDADERLRKLLPGYMTMGENGMGGMVEMGMNVPENSIAMVGGTGPHGEITMGGMFTILKVRQGTQPDAFEGWYAAPPGTQATIATDEMIQRSGIDGSATRAPRTGRADKHPAMTQPPQPMIMESGGGYACPMHPDVTSNTPDSRCPKCGMKLVRRTGQKKGE